MTLMVLRVGINGRGSTKGSQAYKSEVNAEKARDENSGERNFNGSLHGPQRKFPVDSFMKKHGTYHS